MRRRALARAVSAGFILVGVLGFLHMQGYGEGEVRAPTARLQVAVTDGVAFRDFSGVHAKGPDHVAIINEEHEEILRK